MSIKLYKIWVVGKDGQAWSPTESAYRSQAKAKQVVKILDQAAAHYIDLKHPWIGCKVLLEISVHSGVPGNHDIATELIERDSRGKWVVSTMTRQQLMAAWVGHNKTNTKLGLMQDQDGNFHLVSPKLQSTETLEFLVTDRAEEIMKHVPGKPYVDQLTPEVSYYEVDLVTGTVYQDDQGGGLEQVPVFDR